ncbi:Ger(x)C family spore germination protein [Clostridium folliculivorans]|uniref:Spore germination protein GerC n=1 Tax=Clostridium folliculivorans TaxID=2886038 RepID=A0A9W5Y0D2_9CLOT|nr:Ger(x)C family spore germination protein [Clostridium folliculivorans]GKU24207.1 spore germination protein GerC [Clostridium folliculivorans]GKU30312.1 spore germination protein GerC [Clostridium folliculivorans]
MKRSKKILLLPILSLLIFLNGCWDYKEYESMTQVYSLGIDLDSSSKKITVTLQFIPISKSLGEKADASSKGTVYSASAITFEDALAKLQQASPNRLFFGYLQVIVLGEDTAKYIMKDIAEYFRRTPSVRNSVSMVVVPGKAEGVIATLDPNSATSSGKKIRTLLTSYNSNGNVYSVTLHDLMIMLTREGVEPVIPRILTTSANNEGKASGGSSNDIRFAIEKQGNIVASGMAAFKGAKFVGWLNDKETLGLNWILGNKIHTYKYASSEEVNTDSSFPLYSDPAKLEYFYVTRSGSKIKVKIEDDKPVVYINVKIEAALRKYFSFEGGEAEFINLAKVDEIEKNLENSIYSDIEAALRRGKDEFNSDIFGFGFNLYRQHTKEWRNNYQWYWDDIFRDVSVKVNVDAKINNTGTNIKGLSIK